MKILVYGAGVLGSIHAARLFEAGHDVTIVARGERLRTIQSHGILLAEGDSTTVTAVPVPAVEHPSGSYDLIAVFVRSHQVESILATLAEIGGDVLFLLNWAGGPDHWAEALGRERVLLGFPAQGGTMDGDVVRYRKATRLTKLVAMPVSELDGRASERLNRIEEAFRSAGFVTKSEPRMDAWLVTHAAFEVPLGQAVHAAGGLETLAANPLALRRMIRLMKRNLRALPGRPVPRAFGALITIPEGALVPVFRAFLRSTAAAPLSTESAAVTAELELLASQLISLGETSSASRVS